MISNVKKLFWGLLAGCCVSVSCKKNNSSPSPVNSQPDSTYFGRQAFIVSINGNFIVLDSALTLLGGGLADTLAQPGPYTSFLPDNNALSVSNWGAASGNTIYYVSPASDGVKTILSLIVRGAHALRDLPVGRNQLFQSLEGLPLFVSKYVKQGDTLYAVNGTPVLTPDFPTTNGPIEILDGQIPNLVSYATISAYVNSTPELTYLSLALQRSGLDKLLAGTDTLTLLAPSNSAFQSSPDPSLNSIDSLLTADTAKLARVLRCHIIPGRNFLYDFTMQATGMDTLRIPTLLNGETVSLYFQDPYGNPGYLFLGQGNYGPDPNSGAIVPFPAGLYSPSYLQYTADRPVGNGVVHELSGLLTP
jgi:uncharacterized surface protein with fasciclin (FAS1) repeats